MSRNLLRLLCGLGIAGWCMGGSCSIRLGDGDIPLNEADAEIIILQQAGGANASVTAGITDRHGNKVVFGPDQGVSVNGVALSGPDRDGEYTASVPAAAQYVITVAEPTRGVFDTTVHAPADFQITAPAAGATASLSGFEVSWSAAESGVQATVELRQTLLGRGRLKTLGPVPDTGVLAVSADDLRSFQQGADLTVTVTRANDSLAVSGLGSAAVSVQRWAIVAVVPGP